MAGVGDGQASRRRQLRLGTRKSNPPGVSDTDPPVKIKGKGKGKNEKGEKGAEDSCHRRTRRAARYSELMHALDTPADATGAGGTASTSGVVAEVDPSMLAHPTYGEKATDDAAPRKVPGAAASTVCVDVLWNSMTRWLMSSPSATLRRFVHSSFSQQVRRADSSCTPRPVWPIPIPYKGFNYGLPKRERSFQHALNLMVICMNLLHLGQPSSVPRDHHPRDQLTSEQRAIVNRLRHLAAEWVQSSPVTAADMGRAAGKFEQLEETMIVLTRRALALAATSGSGRDRLQRIRSSQPRGPTASLLSEVVAAKDIESDRLQFRGTPSFDPTGLLEDETRQVYADPLKMAMDPSDALQDPPRVQVRGKRAEVMGLFKKLDRTQRLALFTEEQVRLQHRAGLFTLMKDLQRDRLILDARPANQLEEGLTTWTSTMGSIMPLLSLYLPPDKVTTCSGEDLRDYYYFFQVSESRARRNALHYKISLEEAKEFSAYTSAAQGRPYYIPALKTMAMGDLNAVEVGQEAHVKLAMQAGVELKDLITLRGRLPRAPPFVGIVIDGFICVDCIPRPFNSPTEAAALADKMIGTYEAAGLEAHDGKRFRDELKAKFWGASLDRDAGTLRFQLEKILPLAMLTGQIARLGWANRKLLEVVAGAWVAALQCRRRCMCLLEDVFDEIQLYDYDVNFELKSSTVDELWLLVVLCPWFVTDLRAGHCTEFSLVDASNEWEAEVSTQVSPAMAMELGRQRLTKAAWSRLLSPLQAVKKLHGTLTPSEEVPSGEQAAADHPLWSAVVRSSSFELQWRKRIHHRPHINVSELAAALRSEIRRARRFPGNRFLTGSDSQVALGALVKGRSSSKVLNQQLKRALPSVLAYNSYSYPQYISTAENVADDPTRDRPCRTPTFTTPDWVSDIECGQTAGLESKLTERAIDDSSVARLPQQTMPSAEQEVAATSMTMRKPSSSPIPNFALRLRL